jgi:poly [ADP-ribose] polymerase
MKPYTHLVMVNNDKNNYKFYDMYVENYTVRCVYGRIGAGRQQQKVYSLSEFDKIYNSKIRKGYVDQTDYVVESTSQQQTVLNEEKKEKVKNEAKVTDEQIELWYFLKTLTDNANRRVFTNVGAISRAGIRHAKELLEEMKYHASKGDVNSFNECIMEIMAICPRNVSGNGQYGVQSWLTDISYDADVQARMMQRIINREENIILSMSSQLAYNNSSIIVDNQEVGYITDTVKEATPYQEQIVRKHLTDSLNKKVYKIYRVIPEEQGKKYKFYCDKYDIHKKKLLWHGSRNENWLSIIETSLSLNPKAKITGRMFGNGIYFANNPRKSFGYTSSESAYWTNEHSDYAIMGLYETAYGNPHDCYAPHHYSQRELNAEHKNCVHAHKGQYLYNDEIIYYDEDAICLQYIVVFYA